MMLKSAFSIFVVLVVSSCVTPPPKNQSNLCAVFDQYPKWYDYAASAQEKWGTPKQTLMAFVMLSRHSSGFWLFPLVEGPQLKAMLRHRTLFGASMKRSVARYLEDGLI